MAHFAKINDQGIVEKVIAVDNDMCLDQEGHESEVIGAKYCSDILGGRWIQTSYNGNFRKNFASKGFRYDFDLDAFIPLQPYSSWVLDQDTCRWVAPVEQPESTDEFGYSWNEDTLTWEQTTITGVEEPI